MERKGIKILIFTEGTIIYHHSAVGCKRDDIIRQVRNNEKSVRNYSDYIPIGNAVSKIKNWSDQYAEIIYMTSRRYSREISQIQQVLNYHNFVKGEIVYRISNENYSDVAERIMPDIIIEDDCESIGGEVEMTYPQIRPKLKGHIKSIVVKEFEGIDHLPDNVNSLLQNGKTT